MNEATPVSLEREHSYLKDDPPLNGAISASLEAKHHPLENDRSLVDIVQETIHFVGFLNGKKFVVKLGGSTLEHQRVVLQDIIWLHALGANIALVHGGGPYITEWLQSQWKYISCSAIRIGGYSSYRHKDYAIEITPH